MITQGNLNQMDWPPTGFVCLIDSIHPSQQLFSHVGTSLTGFNQYLAVDKSSQLANGTSHKTYIHTLKSVLVLTITGPLSLTMGAIYTDL